VLEDVLVSTIVEHCEERKFKVNHGASE